MVRVVRRSQQGPRLHAGGLLPPRPAEPAVPAAAVRGGRQHGLPARGAEPHRRLRRRHGRRNPGPGGGGAVSARPDGAAGEVPVLMYHSIATDATRKFRRFAVDPAEFTAQMEFLAAAGYQTMTAAELAGRESRAPVPSRAVVLTF